MEYAVFFTLAGLDHNVFLYSPFFLAAGNMRHLIVEACIARNLLDTTAYFWPGYVNARCNQVPRNVPGQLPGWSSLMKGSPLTPPLINALVATPASRYNSHPLSLSLSHAHILLLLTVSPWGRRVETELKW